MEFEVMRVCEGGRKLEKHVRVAGRSRGRISIGQEDDGIRHRAILVARFHPSQGHRPIPALYDVTLIGSTGDTWTLAGFERIEAGPTRFECSVAQTWLLELATVQELIDMGVKWNAAAGEAHELREEIRRLRSSSGTDT
jgi:hypothetical protein